MKEYKQKIEEIRNLYKRFEETMREYHSIEYSIERAEKILALSKESDRCRNLAIKKLQKLAENLGFNLTKDLKKNKWEFEDAFRAIERRVNAAIEALFDLDPRFEREISIAKF